MGVMLAVNLSPYTMTNGSWDIFNNCNNCFACVGPNGNVKQFNITNCIVPFSTLYVEDLGKKLHNFNLSFVIPQMSLVMYFSKWSLFWSMIKKIQAERLNGANALDWSWILKNWGGQIGWVIFLRSDGIFHEVSTWNIPPQWSKIFF